MSSSHPARWINLLVFGIVTAFGCVGTTDTGQQSETGSLSLDLVIADGIVIDQVDWQITGNGMDMSGAIDVSAPGSTASVEVFGLPPGEVNYVVMLTAESTNEQVACKGSAEFNVEVGETTDVMVVLNCKLPRRFGSVRVNGKFNICAELIKAVVSPLETSVGNDIDLSSQAVDQEGDPITYTWTGSGGSIADPSAPSTTYTCQELGDQAITISVTDNDEYCDMATWTIPVTCVSGDGGTGGSGGDGGAGGEAGAGGAGGEAGAGGAGGGIDPDLVCDTNNCQTNSALQAQCVAAVLVCLEENPDAGEEEECIITAIAICNNDCASGGDCGDDNECTADLCVDGACSNPPVMDGNACDNMMGTCQSGVCVPAGDLCEGKDCSDNNECTQDICDSETGECSNPPAMDGTSCTCPVCGAEGVCMMGECVDPCEGVDCSDGNQCTADLCDLGVCSNPTLGPGATCDQDGGVVCDGSGNCVECTLDIQCDVELNETCVDNTCIAVAQACGPQQGIVQVGCTNSLTDAQSPFPFTLSVDVPTAIVGGAAFSATLDGVGLFPQFFLDAAQGSVPGGVKAAELVNFISTVQVRSGATGADVPLGIDVASLNPGPTRFCAAAIPPAVPSVCASDADCVVPSFPPCQPPINLQEVPTLDGIPGSLGGCDSLGGTQEPPDCDCSPCDALGSTAAGQCAINGFCVTGPILVQFDAKVGDYTADASGEVLWGWSEVANLCPGVTCTEPWMIDGCFDIPPPGATRPTFLAPAEPIGIRVTVPGLNIPIQCSMGNDGGECASGEGCLVDADCATGPCIGVGVDDDIICPTPDSDLISCPIN